MVSGVLLFAIGASVCSGLKRYERAADGVLTGVIEKLSSGFASGGDIRFDIVGKRVMLGVGVSMIFDGYCSWERLMDVGKDNGR